MARRRVGIDRRIRVETIGIGAIDLGESLARGTVRRRALDQLGQQRRPFFADDGYTIDSNFENAMDGDNNFRFIGTTGQYYTIIDTVNKTITLQ